VAVALFFDTVEVLGHNQNDDKYRLLASLQAGQKNFRVLIPAQIQLLRLLDIGKDYIYFINLGIY